MKNCIPPIIGVRSEHAEAALTKFKAAGFEPDHVTTAEGEVKYHFPEIPDERLFALASAIPVEWYSKFGVIGEFPAEKN
jgi:hypothetical protein